MKANRRKTECMCVNERQVNGRVKMQREEVVKVDDFKYLGSILYKVMESAEEKRRKKVQPRWNGW